MGGLPFVLDNCQQSQCRSAGLLYATLPIRHQAFADIQVLGKNRLGNLLPLRPNLAGLQWQNIRQASLIELTHRALVDRPTLMEPFHHFMDRSHDLAFIDLAHRISPFASGALDLFGHRFIWQI